MTSVLTLIPSRMASTRFPNKPLALVAGVPMVVRVLQQAQKANVGRVVVAAGDVEIAEAVEAAGGEVVMTDAALPNGSARIWQAAQRLMAQGMARPDIIINAQGDEPVLPPSLLQEAVKAMEAEPEIDVVTFAHEITDPSDIENPTKVKIATNRHGRALYFTRCPAPYGQGPRYHHIGVYAYRRAALEKFVSLPPSSLELREKLEQLRALEAGMRIDVTVVDTVPLGVDTAEDLAKARQLLRSELKN